MDPPFRRPPVGGKSLNKQRYLIRSRQAGRHAMIIVSGAGACGGRGMFRGGNEVMRMCGRARGFEPSRHPLCTGRHKSAQRAIRSRFNGEMWATLGGVAGTADRRWNNEKENRRRTGMQSTLCGGERTSNAFSCTIPNRVTELLLPRKQHVSLVLFCGWAEIF